jgi:hypothetical protein
MLLPVARLRPRTVQVTPYAECQWQVSDTAGRKSTQCGFEPCPGHHKHGNGWGTGLPAAHIRVPSSAQVSVAMALWSSCDRPVGGPSHRVDGRAGQCDAAGQLVGVPVIVLRDVRASATRSRGVERTSRQHRACPDKCNGWHSRPICTLRVPGAQTSMLSMVCMPPSNGSNMRQVI